MLWTPADGEGAHNVVHGGAGDDEIDVDNGTGGFDVVDGGEGDDVIELSAFRFAGDARAGRAVVFGGNGDDTLVIDADVAVVDGGAGDDDYTVFGESIVITDDSGDDTLHLDLADLQQVDAWLDTFPVDLAQAPGWDEGIELLTTAVAQEGGDLVVSMRLQIENFDPLLSELRIEDWFLDARHQIEHIDTGDSEGTVLSAAQFAAWGGLHYGSNAADELVETSDYSDRVFGGGGNDLISTGGGADRILGGAGDDVLVGGSGDDIYYYAVGDGNDAVEDSSGFDEMRFGPGISAANIAVSLDDSGIVLTIGEGRIEVSGGTRSVPGIERLRFADGSVAATTALLPPLPEPVAASPDVPDPVPPQDDPGGDGETLISGGGEPHTDDPQVPPLESPITVAELPASPSVSEPVATVENPVIASPSPSAAEAVAANPVVAPKTVSESTQGGVLQASTFSDPNSLFRGNSASPTFVSSESHDTDFARVNADAPLDMQTMLDAVQSFDAATPAPVGSAQSFSSRQQADEPAARDTSRQELTSWALTNALLQFHLDTIDGRDSGDGAADFSFGDTAFAGVGASLTHQGTGFETFGSRSPTLSTFSGLQEGFTRL